MSVMSGLQSCVAAMMEEEGPGQGHSSVSGQSGGGRSQAQVEEDRQVRAVYEEGLRLKKRVKDLTRVVHDTEEQRYIERQEFERILRDKDIKMDSSAAAHALDIQEMRDSQAVEFHDMLKQLLDCKTTLARKASDVEELSCMLRTIETEHAKREEVGPRGL